MSLLPSSSAALAAAAAASLLLLSLRLAWTRVRLTSRVQPDLRDPARRPAGTFCGWYAHNRRVVVQAFRLSCSDSSSNSSDSQTAASLSCCSVPTLFQLQCALSRVALRHPVLLAMPSPDSDALVSQLSEAEVDKQTQSITFPLAPLNEAVIEVADEQREPEDLIDELLHAFPDAPPAPSAAAFATRHSVPVRWSGVRVYLIRRSSTRFDLVLHTAHVLMDGLSTAALVRMILDELASTVMRADYAAPSRVPLSALQPLAAYPVLDWLCDMRPRLGHALTAVLGSKLPKWISGEKEAWVGRSLAAAEETEQTRTVRDALYADLGRTECILVQLDPAALERLRLAAKREGATVQGVLAIAASLSAAVLAADDPASEAMNLKLGTPFSMRALCAAPTMTSLRVDDLLGNWIGEHQSLHALRDVVRRPFWDQVRSYLSALNQSRRSGVSVVNLIRLIDVPQFLRELIAGSWRARSASVALSNLGVVSLGAASVAAGYQLERAWFIMPAHHSAQGVALLSHAIISTEASGMCDTISYASNTISQVNAERYVSAFKRVLDRVAMGQTCDFAELREWSQMQQLDASPTAIAAVHPAESSSSSLRNRYSAQ